MSISFSWSGQGEKHVNLYNKLAKIYQHYGN